MFTRNAADMIEFSKTAKQGFVKPDAKEEEILFENAVLPHAIMVQNFVNAILDGEPLIAPGEEGINSVELANVMIYSSLLDQTLELPMDGASWEKKLNQLIAESKIEKKVVKGATRLQTRLTARFRRHMSLAGNFSRCAVSKCPDFQRPIFTKFQTRPSKSP